MDSVMRVRSFFIETFGCQMNLHDTEKIAGLLAQRGLVAVPSVEEADLFLLNTCSVREKAAHKVYSRLGEVKRRKSAHPNFLIGVVGCVAQQEGKEMLRKAPFVDLVVGTHMVHTLPDLLDEIQESHPLTPRVATQFLVDRSPVEIPELVRQSPFRANVTIMEGCNKHCSFCIVPHTRGKERNRPSKLILDEIRLAVDQGFVEVLLLGQTVNSYRDPDHPRLRFAELLSQAARIPGVKRLRFTSPHPREFQESTLDVLAENENICNHVHLPLQSGSNAVLKRMRRQHDREEYLTWVDRFRDCGREMALSTDMIVGFPGESSQDFDQTLSLVQEVLFESMFSFKYSPRPFTEAHNWTDEVEDSEKTQRLMALQSMQQKIQLRIHHEKYLGRDFQILVEGTARDGVQRFGRTTSNKIVNFPGEETPGTFVQVRINQVGPNSLRGQRLERTQHNCP
ncbi:MAG: tRNA (N6-isopentenyl adenosine(37)-C2)-methylthiotransferase MiaB [Acidobacteriota bacterium]